MLPCVVNDVHLVRNTLNSCTAGVKPAGEVRILPLQGVVASCEWEVLPTPFWLKQLSMSNSKRPVIPGGRLSPPALVEAPLTFLKKLDGEMCAP